MRRLAAVLLCALALPVPAALAWSWPTDGPVLKTFVFDPAHPYTGGQHRGIDVAGPAGSPVLAPVDGVVTFAGTVPSSGKVVSIATAEGTTATLVHLGSISVSRGALVSEASVVGAIGPSGDPEVGEPYVHLGVRITANPQGYIDPLSLLPARPTPAPPETAATPAAEPVAGSPSLESPAVVVQDPLATIVAEILAASVPAAPITQSTTTEEPATAAETGAVATGSAASDQAAILAAQDVVPTAERAPAVDPVPAVPGAVPLAAAAGAHAAAAAVSVPVVPQGSVPAASVPVHAVATPAPLPVNAPAEVVGPAEADTILAAGPSLPGQVLVETSAEVSPVEMPERVPTEAVRPVTPPRREGRAARQSVAPGRLSDRPHHAALVVPTSQGASRGRVGAAVAEPSPRAFQERTAPVAATSSARASGLGEMVAPASLAVVLAIFGVAALLARRRRAPSAPGAARIMSLPGSPPETEQIPGGLTSEAHSGRTRVAVRERAEAPRSSRGLRGSGRHLRSLPPLEGRSSPDGERNGRARYACDGDRRPGRRLAA